MSCYIVHLHLWAWVSPHVNLEFRRGAREQFLPEEVTTPPVTERVKRQVHTLDILECWLFKTSATS